MDFQEWKKLSTTVNFHDYQMIGKLGAGTFGTVFKVHEKNDVNAVFAIKCMILYNKNDDSVDDFGPIREISDYITLQPQHPNVVKVYSVTIDVEKKCVNLVMELCDNDLEHVLRNNNVSKRMMLQWTYDLFAGLNYLHENGIIEADLKPGNCLLKNNELKITDFGISMLSEGYRLDYVHGSHPYISPEMICKCSKQINGANDIWSVGLIIAKMFFDFSITLDPNQTLEDYIFRHIGYPTQKELMSEMMKGSLNCQTSLRGLYVTHRHLRRISPEWLCNGNVAMYQQKYGDKMFHELIDLIQQCLQIHPLERPSWRIIRTHPLFENCEKHDTIRGHYISLKKLVESEYIVYRPQFESIIRDVLGKMPSLYESNNMLDAVELVRTKKEINALKFDLSSVFVLAGALMHESLIKLQWDAVQMKQVKYEDRFFHEAVCVYIAFAMSDTSNFLDPIIYLKHYLLLGINHIRKIKQPFEALSKQFDRQQLILYSTIGFNLYELLRQ